MHLIKKVKKKILVSNMLITKQTKTAYIDQSDLCIFD